jgi:1,2-diacylglycerol 3-beta-glucosyltransferase
MASRLIAAGLLIGSALLAWLVIASSLAARLLQAVIGLSVLYVGYLAYRGWQLIRASLAAGSERERRSATASGPNPFLSVVVPARNEAPVIFDVVKDLVGQRYGASGRPAFEVVVLDAGSDDGTGELATQAASAAGTPPDLFRLLPRELVAGTTTKGAALAKAMPHLRGATMAVLDADARVAPDFLSGVMAAWSRDQGAAAIQARRHPINEGHSWLTAAQAEEQLMDLASQCGRRQADGTAELRGNGMVVRRDILERVGGWSARAITEDLDLSTRLAAAGEHVALAPEVLVGEEAVTTLGDLWTQRMRWAEGSLRRLMEHGPRLLLGSAPLARKLDFLAFTTEFVIPPLFAASVIASVVTIPLPIRMDWTIPTSLFAGYGLGSLLLALAGLSGVGIRGAALVGRSLRGAAFLSHWLVVVPTALLRIAIAPETTTFRKTPRMGHAPADR